jgi:2-succinyl-5-enolpyruvyl-6-hydroxy-3-cyclohexene-1-carboxylate synthase
MSISTNLARHTVRQLIELGVADVVLSPGSRNAPLSIALHQAQEHGLIRLHVRIDERGAAFFALGIAKASGRYVPVVCTSGTAVANFFPAVLEAHHSDLRLLLLTADRPAKLRKTGSNQTTNQKDIFKDFVRKSIDTAAPIDLTEILSQTGPVHINLQFDEPLLPTDSKEWLTGIKPINLTPIPLPHSELNCETSRNVIIVGHDRAGFTESEIENLSRSLGAPLISEDPLRFKDALAHASIILSSEKARTTLTPELVIVIGRTTLSRNINAYIELAERVIVIDPRTSQIDTNRSADEILHSIPKATNSTKDDNWRQLWSEFEAKAKSALIDYPSWSEGALASIVAKDLENDTALFISSSRPIRDMEAFATPRADLVTYANRGLAGIDGNISTALGIATQHDETFAILGDLAFLHDISALANPTDDALTILVVDNNGGGIFSTLPQRGVPGFEKLFGTPHNQDLAKIVAGFGISHEVVASAKELEIALKRIHPKTHVIIAKMPNREENAEFLKNVISKYSMSL